MPRLCQWVPGCCLRGMAPSRRLTHLKTKASEAHLRLPRDQTRLSQATFPATPSGSTLLWEAVMQWPRSDRPPVPKKPNRGSPPKSQSKLMAGSQKGPSHYIYRHHIELNRFKTT